LAYSQSNEKFLVQLCLFEFTAPRQSTKIELASEI